MITRSRKLSLKLVYQLTHQMMICRSKCRPLNRSSIGTNRCISSSSPASLAFAPEPTSPHSNTVNPVTVTIGGNPAQVLFAGLAPGYAGLYQVNVVVPEGVTPGANVPVILTTAAFSSPPVTVAVQ
jgi:hypothetical protein